LDPEGKASEARVLELLNSAHLGKIASRDPENRGLDMLITENGANLSSGEKQLICICRAILRKTKIVILDEATANIDVVLEQRIQELISKEFQDATVLTIAHRINTIVNSDRVLVLSFGEVKEYAEPKILLVDQESEFSKILEEIRKAE
jgi:ABC-type multidrug transport system fused ATPase/permease subunit